MVTLHGPKYPGPDMLLRLESDQSAYPKPLPPVSMYNPSIESGTSSWVREELSVCNRIWACTLVVEAEPVILPHAGLVGMFPQFKLSAVADAPLVAQLLGPVMEMSPDTIESARAIPPKQSTTATLLCNSLSWDASGTGIDTVATGPQESL